MKTIQSHKARTLLERTERTARKKAPLLLPSPLVVVLPNIRSLFSSPSSRRETYSAIWSHSPICQAAFAAYENKKKFKEIRLPITIYNQMGNQRYPQPLEPFPVEQMVLHQSIALCTMHLNLPTEPKPLDTSFDLKYAWILLSYHYLWRNQKTANRILCYLM